MDGEKETRGSITSELTNELNNGQEELKKFDQVNVSVFCNRIEIQRTLFFMLLLNDKLFNNLSHHCLIG